MPYSTLISFYGPKPAAFAGLIAECQAEVAAMLGEQFEPYDSRQVHCTIAALDRVGESGMLNSSFLKLRNRRVEMDLVGLMTFLRDVEPMQIQIGGFAEGESPFLSRDLPPYRRSFTMQAGKAVVMGWPADSSGYPPRLESLRCGLQRFGVLHGYHAKPGDIDNDFYLRIGLYDSAAVSPVLADQVERRLRDFLSRRPPLMLSLGVADLAFAQSDQVTLPSGTTALLPLSTASIDAKTIARFFGWNDVL